MAGEEAEKEALHDHDEAEKARRHAQQDLEYARRMDEASRQAHSLGNAEKAAEAARPKD